MMAIAINLTNTIRKKEEESIVKKIPLFSLVLASLTPLIATSASAQGFDLLGTYQNQRLLDTFCANNPHLRNQKECRYYWQNKPQRTRPNNSRRRTRPNTFTPNSGSTNLKRCGKIVRELLELHNQGVAQATVTLPGGGTITDSPDDLIDDVLASCNRSSNAASPILSIAPQTTSTASNSSDRRYEEGTRLLYEPLTQTEK